MTDRPTRTGPSRRTVLVGGAAVVGVGALGAGATVRLTDESYLRDTLERLVGAVRMAPADFSSFARAFRARFDELDSIRAMPFRAGEAIGASPLLERYAPLSIGEKMERFERTLVTDFLTRTDWLFMAADEPVGYLGEGPCANPFAEV